MLNDLQYYFGAVDIFNIMIVDVVISWLLWGVLLIIDGFKGKKDELITNTEGSFFKPVIIFLIVSIIIFLSIRFCFCLNLKDTDYKQMQTIEYQIDKDDVTHIKKLNKHGIRIVVKDLNDNILKEKIFYVSKNIKDFTKVDEKVFKIKVNEYKVDENNFTKIRKFLISHPKEFNLITEIN